MSFQEHLSRPALVSLCTYEGIHSGQERNDVQLVRASNQHEKMTFNLLQEGGDCSSTDKAIQFRILVDQENYSVHRSTSLSSKIVRDTPANGLNHLPSSHWHESRLPLALSRPSHELFPSESVAILTSHGLSGPV